MDTDPDPAKWCRSDRIRIHNTANDSDVNWSHSASPSQQELLVPFVIIIYLPYRTYETILCSIFRGSVIELSSINYSYSLVGAQVSLEARLEDERKTAMEVREKFSRFFWRPLKGAWHEIFDFRFSSWISFLEPLGPIWAFFNFYKNSRRY